MKENRFTQLMIRAGLAFAICLTALFGGGALRTEDAIQASRTVELRTDSSDNLLSAETTPGVLSLKQNKPQNSEELRLYPGGMPFGVKLYTNGILIVGFGEVDSADGPVNPAYQAGLRVRDVITHLDGIPLQNVESMTEAIERGSGAPMTITYTRGSEVCTTTVTPVRSVSEGKYKTGMWVRDSGAGIGTVTFIDPTTGAFGGLGHGICDADTGELMPMQRGIVTDVTITGVLPGAPGSPGELRGKFLPIKRGALIRNTECGVYGVFSSLPDAPEGPLPIARKDELHTGEAYIWCTLDENGPSQYRVELSAINKNADGAKCFTVKVTDPALIAKTGGIVQGMGLRDIRDNTRNA